jgi:hypothetical protein
VGAPRAGLAAAEGRVRPEDVAGIEAAWPAETEAVLTGMTEWWLAHPTATLAEIEAAVDERLAPVRARMVERMALASRAADPAGKPPGERARCPGCGAELRPRGAKTRAVVTQGGAELRLARDWAVCPSCGTGLFPPG